ncbi:MAG TPA: hypothetical protein VGO62_09070, partial [Myxococcota bacterium]
PAVSAPVAKPVKVAAPGTVKVIVLDLKAATLSSAESSAITSLVTVALSEYSAFEVVSGADVREMMTLEGEKQSLGCEESMSCIAEIAGALGARLVAFGQIEKLGTRFIMSVNLQDTKEGKSVGRIALQGDSIDALAAAVPDAVHRIALNFLTAERLSIATTSARVEAPKLAVAQKGDLSWLAWSGGIVAVAGATTLAVGTLVLLGIASSSGAPGQITDTARIPIAGPFLIATQPTKTNANTNSGDCSSTGCTNSSNNNNNNNSIDQGTQAIFFLVGGVEALIGVATAGGALSWSIAEVSDGPKLGVAGNAWRFGLLAGGLGLVAGGVAFDASTASSNNHRLEGTDFVAPAMEIVGVTAAIVGLAANPFPAEDAQ